MPTSVNLKAFESRLFRICCNRCSSVTMVGARCRSMSTRNPRPFSCAIGPKACSTTELTFWRATSAACTSILPASIFDRSRMSLMSDSRELPDAWIVRANSNCLSVRLP